MKLRAYFSQYVAASSESCSSRVGHVIVHLFCAALQVLKGETVTDLYLERLSITEEGMQQLAQAPAVSDLVAVIVSCIIRMKVFGHSAAQRPPNSRAGS